MEQLSFILSHFEDYYVAVVESSIGIVANTVRSKNKEFHLNFLHKIKSKLSIENIVVLCSSSLHTDILFQLNEAPMKSCHLVIKADQSLGNYSADEPEVKCRLLKIEGVNLVQFNYNYLMKIV